MGGITGLSEWLGVQPTLIAAATFAFGIMLLAGAVTMILRDRKRAAALQRMRAAQPERVKLLRDIAGGGDGLLDRVFVPTAEQERSKLRRDLAHAGFRSPDAALTFNLIRFGAGLVLPMAVATVYLFPTKMPAGLLALLPQLQMAQVMLVCGLIIGVGFYGPGIWLAGRASDRRLRIENSFPNALDLLQVGVEAGMAFDAALARVGEEMRSSAPEVCDEFRVVQTEILAGRDREAAYRDMADRLGIDEAFGFVNVVSQSIRFGTSMSSALLTYSAEMRQRREMRAQEKANRLPVLMSAVMAGLMMPALLIVTIGPVVLRYLETNLNMP
jgi:tight adherence protein C